MWGNQGINGVCAKNSTGKWVGRRYNWLDSFNFVLTRTLFASILLGLQIEAPNLFGGFNQIWIELLLVNHGGDIHPPLSCNGRILYKSISVE